jgi:hypothetical protein
MLSMALFVRVLIAAYAVLKLCQSGCASTLLWIRVAGTRGAMDENIMVLLVVVVLFAGFAFCANGESDRDKHGKGSAAASMARSGGGESDEYSRFV